MALVSYLKPLKFIPTFVAIFLVPSHFFRRVPRILTGAPTPYMTPIGFFSGSIAISIMGGVLHVYQTAWLIAAADLGLAGSQIGRPLQGLPLALLLWITSPLWLSLMSATLFALLLVGYATGYSNKTPDICLVPLAPSTYRALIMPRLIWNSLYFGVYFLPMAPIFGILMFAALVGLFERSDWTVLNLGPLKLVQFLSVCAPLSWIAVRPYVAMLRASVRVPTALMLTVDVEEIAARARTVGRFPTDGGVEELKRAFVNFMQANHLDEFDLRRQSPALRAKYSGDRADALWRIPVFALETALESATLTETGKTQLRTIIDDVEELRATSHCRESDGDPWRRPLKGRAAWTAVIVAAVAILILVTVLILRGA